MDKDICLIKSILGLKEDELEYRKEYFQQREDIINESERFDKTKCYEELLSSVTLNTDPKMVNENCVVTHTFLQ